MNHIFGDKSGPPVCCRNRCDQRRLEARLTLVLSAGRRDTHVSSGAGSWQCVVQLPPSSRRWRDQLCMVLDAEQRLPCCCDVAAEVRISEPVSAAGGTHMCRPMLLYSTRVVYDRLGGFRRVAPSPSALPRAGFRQDSPGLSSAGGRGRCGLLELRPFVVAAGTIIHIAIA